MLELIHESSRPVDLASTTAPLRHGSGDPCHRTDATGAVWRASGLPSGPVTYRLTQVDRYRVRCQAWGPGAEELAAGLGALLGESDDATSFFPEHPKLKDAHRRHTGLRIPRTGLVMESLVPAILEQKVTGLEALRAWRLLVTRHGSVPPGPAPAGMRVPPTAEQWRFVPSWDFHQAGVDPKRSRTIVACARIAVSLEGCAQLSCADAKRRLMAVPGIGEWTAAEVGQRALGDADALSVGDYHLCKVIGWSMLGRPIDDAQMLEYLEPLRPHRHRVVRLLEVSGQAVKPRFGPRMTIQDHRRH
jgi:3-methyladenine DNA glycosylase/8-oxoguanine DNA glycosylase